MDTYIPRFRRVVKKHRLELTKALTFKCKSRGKSNYEPDPKPIKKPKKGKK